MKKIAGIFLCGIVLICTILVGVIMPTIAESVEVEISDFEASQPLATVTYGNGIVVEEVGSPVYKGSQSMKLPLQYANRDTVITYNISKDTNFPAGEKRYVSFWMSSDVNCKIKLQLPDIDWGGDAFYDVDIQAGAHLYNVDVSNCTYSGVRGIMFLQKGEYYADGTDAFSGVGYLDSLVLTNAERKLPVVTTTTGTPSAPAETLISDFEASQPLATVTYGNGIVVEAVGSPVYKGSQSMKLPLQYANRDTVITYNISKDTNFPAGEKRYVSFWMSSDVNCKIKLQLPDINWGGDAFYDVDIQAGAHLYNVDVSNCTYSGVRGIIFLQKGEYYADGTDAFSGVGYLDSLVLTNAERKLPVVTTKTDTTTTTSTQPTTTVSSKASAGWMMTDFEDDQLTPKEGPYMRKGVEYDIVTSPVYSGSRSLKLIMNYDGPWTKTEWGLEPAKWENWFTLGNETKYLSFWMNSDVDCVLRFQLLDPDYADDLSLKVDVRKGTYMYNVDISQYTKTKIRGVMILLTADDYEDEDSDKDAPLWKGTAYIDSLMFTEQTRELPAVSTTTSNTTVMTVTKPDMPETGVVSSTFPIILLALGAGTFMLVVNKKRG